MSQKASGFERQVGDQYMTPEWVAETLAEVMPIYGHIWEPACGEGAIVNVLRKSGMVSCRGTDIDTQFSDNSIDFLGSTSQAYVPPSGHFSIITNPPYGKGGKLAEKFVRHAIFLSGLRCGRAAMLLPVDWDAAKTRHDLFEDFLGHVTKITLTERIRWTNLPQSKSGPSQNHAWFIWDHARKGRDMRWLGRVK